MTGGIISIHVSTNQIGVLVLQSTSLENILTNILFSPEQKSQAEGKEKHSRPQTSHAQLL